LITDDHDGASANMTEHAVRYKKEREKIDSFEKKTARSRGRPVPLAQSALVVWKLSVTGRLPVHCRKQKKNTMGV